MWDESSVYILGGDKMQAWLLVVVGMILILIFTLWLDWKFKCRKIINDNKMILFVNGYAIFKDDSVEPILWMLSGLLGVNSEELVFGHRFKDEAMYFNQKLSDVNGFEIVQYDEEAFLRLIRECCDVQGDTVKYAVMNMAGVSTSSRIPKMLQSRTLCKISFVTGAYFLVCIRDTAQNTEMLERIRSKVCSISR